MFQNLPEDHWIGNTGNERKRNRRGSRDGHGPVHTGPRKKGEKLQYYSKCCKKSLHNKMQSVSSSKTPPSSHSATNHRAKLDLPELLLGLSHSSILLQRAKPFCYSETMEKWVRTLFSKPGLPFYFHNIIWLCFFPFIFNITVLFNSSICETCPMS